MADVELVIKIPEEIYSSYMNYTENFVDFMFFGTEETVVKAIRNGTPLPKGHGRLIDAGKLLDAEGIIVDTLKCHYIPMINVYEAPTIIEADTESEE